MKKTIPFEIFGPNQYLMFDILRLAELEKALGRDITDLLRKQDAGINFCLAALPIGLKQHYHQATAAEFAAKIEGYLEDGGSLDEIAVPLIKAIIASGIFGRQLSEKMDEIETGGQDEAKKDREGTA